MYIKTTNIGERDQNNVLAKVCNVPTNAKTQNINPDEKELNEKVLKRTILKITFEWQY